MTKRLLIIGYQEPTQIGSHFYNAAQTLNIDVQLLDTSPAFQANWLHRQIHWRLLGHRPPKLHLFSQQIVDTCITYRPDYILVTGNMPLHVDALRRIRQLGIICLNFLTDDPWNQSQGSTWFRQSLPTYDKVFSPRQSNLADLQALGCEVAYLPFGYEPSLHFPEVPPANRQSEFACDVLFYGGADKDRLPYARAILQAGYNLHLYGGYWNRDRLTQTAWRGFADPQTLRWAVAWAKVTLCLVRRSNRDGHVMRTFEVPAMGGCMLAEDTTEHRQLMGDTVLYFQNSDDIVDKIRKLLEDEIFRNQMAENAHQRTISGNHSYADRLQNMLETVKQ
jgi:spore maturation protein CgeB